MRWMLALVFEMERLDEGGGFGAEPGAEEDGGAEGTVELPAEGTAG